MGGSWREEGAVRFKRGLRGPILIKSNVVKEAEHLKMAAASAS
jgi:hypothetical protein